MFNILYGTDIDNLRLPKLFGMAISRRISLYCCRFIGFNNQVIRSPPLSMKAVLLAAGLSTRLYPQTLDLPKPLVPVRGVPLLARALTALSSAGIESVVIVTGYLHTLVEQFTIGLTPKPSPVFVRNTLFEQTGNNYSLALAAPHLNGEEMLLLDGDILFSPALLEVLLHSAEKDALLVRTRGEVGDEEVKVTTDSTGAILRIGKDIDPSVAAGESIGLAKFCRATTARLFHSLDARKSRREFYEASFQEIIEEGAVLRAIPCEPHPCIEIDTPEDLAHAEALATEYGL